MRPRGQDFRQTLRAAAAELFVSASSILVAVAWSKFTRELFSQHVPAGHDRTAYEFVYAAVLYLALLAAMGSCCLRRSRFLWLYVGMAGELLGFALKDALGYTQQHYFSEKAETMVLLALVAGLAMALAIELCLRLRQGMRDADLALAAHELELDAACYAAGYLLNQALLGVAFNATASNEAADLQGAGSSGEEDSDDTALHALGLFYYCLVLSLVAGGVIARTSTLKLSSASTFLEKSLAVTVGFAYSVAGAFAFDEEGRTEEDEIWGALQYALLVTAVSLLVVTVLRVRTQAQAAAAAAEQAEQEPSSEKDRGSWLARRRAALRRRGPRRSTQLAIAALALVAGWAWEEFVTAIIDAHAGSANVRLAFKAIFAAVITAVLPTARVWLFGVPESPHGGSPGSPDSPHGGVEQLERQLLMDEAYEPL